MVEDSSAAWRRTDEQHDGGQLGNMAERQLGNMAVLSSATWWKTAGQHGLGQQGSMA